MQERQSFGKQSAIARRGMVDYGYRRRKGIGPRSSLAAALISLALALGSLLVPFGASLMSFATGCTIKGNISYNGGRKIFHVPGQQNYDDVIINFRAGERYFCSEDEARAAGWVKARR